MSYTDEWLELEKNIGGRTALGGSAEEMRAQYDQIVQLLLPTMPKPSDAVTSQDGEVDGIKYRVYTPTEEAAKGPLPVGIWTHGGGYVTGDINSDDLLCRVIAEHAPSIIVNVDYRLAPEHKLPTQVQDTLAVYKWARQNASSIGGDPSKFYSIGGSAGGGIALQVANRIVKDPSKRAGIRGVAAIVPITLHPDHVPEEYKASYTAYQENGEDAPIINRKSMDDFFGLAGADPKDPDQFVALDAENHKNYPPVYFVSCARDPLRDDSYVLESALKKAGVPTKHDHYDKLPHYFWIFPSIPEGQKFVTNLIGGVKWLISQM